MCAGGIQREELNVRTSAQTDTYVPATNAGIDVTDNMNLAFRGKVLCPTADNFNHHEYGSPVYIFEEPEGLISPAMHTHGSERGGEPLETIQTYKPEMYSQGQEYNEFEMIRRAALIEQSERNEWVKNVFEGAPELQEEIISRSVLIQMQQDRNSLLLEMIC